MELMYIIRYNSAIQSPYLTLSLVSIRAVRLDWSPPGRPSGIMLGYEILRRTRRSCAVGSPVGGESAVVGQETLRCTYVQCPAGLGVCGTTCYHPDSQVSEFYSRLFMETFATLLQRRGRKERSVAVFRDVLSLFSPNSLSVCHGQSRTNRMSSTGISQTHYPSLTSYNISF